MAMWHIDNSALTKNIYTALYSALLPLVVTMNIIKDMHIIFEALGAIFKDIIKGLLISDPWVLELSLCLENVMRCYLTFNWWKNYFI